MASRNSPARIVVVGSSNTDMVVKSGHLPLPGETVLGGEFIMTAGGKGANQAVSAARLGGEVTFVGRVGTDVFGEQALAETASAGIDVSYVIRDESVPSGVALIFVDHDGQNSIVVAPGANGRLTPADVDAAKPAFERADVIVAQFEVPLDAVEAAIRLGRELGKTVIIDPAPACELPTGFLNGVDFITPNEHEACSLLGRNLDSSFDPFEAVRALKRFGISFPLVTLGAGGCALLDGSSEVIAEAPLVTAVDSTAAGDCFTGALAVALGEGRSLQKAVELANAAAALSVTAVGAQASLPNRAAVEELLKAH